jgi:uncharacterized metal-binding protein YceD (DUF177 family)
MELQLFIDRLKEGQVETFAAELCPQAIGLEDAGISFTGKVGLEGTAYIAVDHLIIKLQAHAIVKVPCSICNEETGIKIQVSNFYHTEPVSAIAGSVFDFTHLLREDILLQVPQFTECHQGKCPERELIKKYIKKESVQPAPESPGPVHFPFSNL